MDPEVCLQTNGVFVCVFFFLLITQRNTGAEEPAQSNSPVTEFL